MPLVDPKGSGARGQARMREIAALKVAETEVEKQQMLDALGRVATPSEVIECEIIAATCVRARHLRKNGKDDSAERQLLQRLMRKSIFGSVPAPHPAEVQHGKAAGDAFVARERDWRAAAVERDQENYRWYRSVTGADAGGDPDVE